MTITGQILLIPARQIPCVAETHHTMTTVLAVISTKCMSILSADVGSTKLQSVWPELHYNCIIVICSQHALPVAYFYIPTSRSKLQQVGYPLSYSRKASKRSYKECHMQDCFHLLRLDAQNIPSGSLPWQITSL